MRPSVIFFDEIDGLAPVRSSKQDQIHVQLCCAYLIKWIYRLTAAKVFVVDNFYLYKGVPEELFTTLDV